MPIKGIFERWDFGWQVRQHREQADLTLLDVAVQIRSRYNVTMDPGALSLIENGKRSAPRQMSTLDALAKILKVDKDSDDYMHLIISAGLSYLREDR